MKKKIKPTRFSEEEIRLITLLHANNASWDDKIVIGGVDYTQERDKIKESLQLWLVDEQANECAYCLLPMVGGPDLEHLAKKSSYPNLTFDPKNIVAACLICNRKRKFAKNVVINDRGTYDRWDFSIVHPILQSPSDHMRFDPDWVFIEAIYTPEADETIKMFELLEVRMVLEREKCAAHKNQRISRLEERLLEEIMRRPRNRFG